MNERASKFFQAVVIIVGIGFLVYMWQSRGHELSIASLFLPERPILHIGDIPIRVDVAQTDAQRVQGLSGRESIGPSEGLLFVFPEASFHAMWMKDMRFPIDVIWISEDLKIVSIDDNVRPDTYPNTFRPAAPAKYALETHKDFVETFGILKGQTVRIPLEYLER